MKIVKFKNPHPSHSRHGPTPNAASAGEARHADTRQDAGGEGRRTRRDSDMARVDESDSLFRIDEGGAVKIGGEISSL